MLLHDGVESQITVPSSGVLQGVIILSTLRFLKNPPLLNNSPSTLYRILEFTDDVKLFMNIESILDCMTLQADKNQLVSWGKGLIFKLNFQEKLK